MEATVAVGVVSSAVQFTDFSTRLIRLARVIYKNGSDRIPEKLNAQALIEGAKESIDEMAREYSTPADAATIDLISRCRIVITDIEALFPSNNSVSTNKLLKGFRSSSKAIAFLWKKSDFDESMNRLNQLKAELYAKFHKDKLREALIQHETTHQEALVQFEHVMMQQSQNHTVLIIIVITISALLIAVWIQQYQGFTVLVQQHDTKLQEEVLDWLSEANLNFSRRHQEILSVRAPGTGSWLLEHDEYKHWTEDGRNETLWLRGIPGSGKTVLAAIAIDHLRKKKRAARFAVAYVYCDYKDDERQTPENMMSEIVRQVVQKRPLSQELLEFYEQHKADRTRPSLSELTAILEQEINRLSTTFLVIDAVDELIDRKRGVLLREVAKMTKILKIMITSRPHIHPETRFPNSTVLEIVATRQDIERYANYRMASDSDSNLAEIVADAPDLQRQIAETVCNKSRGLFLLSQLHLNLLEDNREKRALRRTLNSLPDTLGAVYENTIDRINSQSEKDRKTAIRALQWLVNSHRPLDIRSLQHALAIEHDTNSFDKEGIIEEKSLLLLCKGLIVVDQEQTATLVRHRSIAVVTGKPVRLAHQSVHEYLKSRNDFHSDEIDGRIAHDCLTYVSYRNGMCDYAYLNFRKPLDDNLYMLPLIPLSGMAMEYPLYGYAATYWPEHARGRAEASLSEGIGRFIGQHSNFWCASQFDLAAGSEEGYQPIPFLAFYNLAYTIRHIPNEILIRHSVDLEQLTSAMMTAARRGNVEAFRSLIEGSLLERLGLTVSHQQLVGNALITAVLLGDKSMAAVSIGAGASANILTSADIRVPSTLQECFRQLWVTPLCLACFRKDSDMVEFLLANGAYPNAACSMLPLEIASLMGHIKIVKQLLTNGADVTLGSRWLGSPLFAASLGGKLDIVNLLLDKGCYPLKQVTLDRPYSCQRIWPCDEDVKAQNRVPYPNGSNGMVTALQAATTCNHTEVARVLAARGSFEGVLAFLSNSEETLPSIQQMDAWRERIVIQLADLLEIAVEHANSDIVRILLEAGARADGEDRSCLPPLIAAIELGRDDVVELLLDFGANASEEAITTAVFGRSGFILNLLLRRRAIFEQWKWWPERALFLVRRYTSSLSMTQLAFVILCGIILGYLLGWYSSD